MFFLPPLSLLWSLPNECIDIPRYIGDLEQEIKNLEEQIAASDATNSLPSTPTPVHTRIPGHTNSRILQRDILPGRRERHSSNFVEGGGIR